jgi:nucleoside-diphosphate kinase
MYDIKNKRLFLKRCLNPNVTMDELEIGATVTIYSRKLRIVEYTDEATR